MSIFTATLKSGCQGLGIDISDIQIKKMEQYYELLIETNKVMNLTNITDPIPAAYLHIIDAISPIVNKHISGSIIDVGSGAGLPGIPIAIFRPDVQVTMMDSRGKRTDFIMKAVLELGLTNAGVICDRAENLSRDKQHREVYDVALARAVAPLNVLCEYLFPFVKVGGKVVAYKGPSVLGEVKTAKTAIRVLGGGEHNVDSYINPHESRKMSIFACVKDKKTNKKYPRGTGRPSKFPIK